MLYLAFLLFIVALFLFWQARRQRKAAGLPGGRVIYTDTRGWGPVEEPLYHPDLGLTGKPDYIVEQEGLMIPIEVKSSRVSDAPYDGHIFQLAAYCLLVTYAFGKRPTYGILHYPNRTYRIDYTPDLESATLDLLNEIRAVSRAKEVHRSHESTSRCRSCGYRTLCTERLA